MLESAQVNVPRLSHLRLGTDNDNSGNKWAGSCFGSER
jgi:hypothetical protein